MDASPLAGLVPGQDELAELLGSLGDWTYAVAAGMAFVEVGTPIGLITPSELGVPFAGAAAAAGAVGLLPLIAVVWVCASIGDSVGYLTGRKLGRTFLVRHGPRIRLTETRLRRLEDLFDRRGAATVVLARFGAYVRTLTPFVAGAARMPYRRFVAASVAGSALWAVVLCVAGFVFFDSLSLVADVVTGVGAVVAGAAVVAALALLLRARTRPPRRWPARPPG